MRQPFDGDYILTQGFGVNKVDYVQFGLEGHNGLDYGLPMRTEVLAPHNGKVIEATLDPKGYGLYIKIENEKEGSVLAHFAELRVGVGDQLEEGQLIAYSDTSGNSTGPHLHWGYYKFPRDKTNGYNGYIDQINLITDTNQAIIDSLRNERDKNWNLYQTELTKNNDLVKQLQDEQAKSQNLRDAFDLQTSADASTGAELLAVSHERDDYLNRLSSLKEVLSSPSIELTDLLGVIDNLRKPTDQAVKEVVPVLEEQFKNLQKSKIKGVVEWLKLGFNIIVNKIVNRLIQR